MSRLQRDHVIVAIEVGRRKAVASCGARQSRYRPHGHHDPRCHHRAVLRRPASGHRDPSLPLRSRKVIRGPARGDCELLLVDRPALTLRLNLTSVPSPELP